MRPFKFIKRLFEAKVASKDFDFSTFVPATPLTGKQRLIEECNKRDVSIYTDDPTELPTSIFRSVASEAELERRLNAEKAIAHSKRANVIALFSLLRLSYCSLQAFLMKLLT